MPALRSEEGSDVGDVKETVEILGVAGCPRCRGRLTSSGPLVWVRLWRHDSPHSRTAGPGEVWHRSCAEREQKDQAEERALELLSKSLAA